MHSLLRQVLIANFSPDEKDFFLAHIFSQKDKSCCHNTLKELYSVTIRATCAGFYVGWFIMGLRRRDLIYFFFILQHNDSEMLLKSWIQFYSFSKYDINKGLSSSKISHILSQTPSLRIRLWYFAFIGWYRLCKGGLISERFSILLKMCQITILSTPLHLKRRCSG